MKYFLLIFFTIFKSIFADDDADNEEPEKLQFPEPHDGWPYGLCRSENEASPIDIPSMYDTKSLVIDDNSYVKIHTLTYQKINNDKVSFDGKHHWSTRKHPIDEDLGTIVIEIDGKNHTYKYEHIHFHLYSEHRIGHKQYPMEMHIEHRNINHEESEIPLENLVIAVLFDYNNNVNSNFLDRLKLSTEDYIVDADLSTLYNKSSTYYYYKGGLTTPPCSENVNWIVMKDVRNMSYAQFKNFERWIIEGGKEYYGTGYGNARGPKPLNNRRVYLENYYNVNNNDAENEEQSHNNKISKSGLSGGAIAGIAIASFLLACIIGVVVFIISRKYKNRHKPYLYPNNANNNINNNEIGDSNAKIIVNQNNGVFSNLNQNSINQNNTLPITPNNKI